MVPKLSCVKTPQLLSALPPSTSESPASDLEHVYWISQGFSFGIWPSDSSLLGKALAGSIWFHNPHPSWVDSALLAWVAGWPQRSGLPGQRKEWSGLSEKDCRWAVWRQPGHPGHQDWGLSWGIGVQSLQERRILHPWERGSPRPAISTLIFLDQSVGSQPCSCSLGLLKSMLTNPQPHLPICTL